MRLIVPSVSQVEEFIDFLYGGLEGFVYCPVKNLAVKPDEEGHWTQNFMQWPEQRDNLISFIEETSSKYDVYLSPVIFNSANSRKDSIKSTNVIWVELDELLPTGTDGNIPNPNYKVQTSSESHQHWYWKLDNPITSFESIELFTRALTFAMPGADSSGWDANQVLRIPGTYNYKRNTPVTAILTAGPVLNNEAFRNVPPPPPQRDQIDLTTIPDVTEIVLKYPWNKDASKLYLTITPPVEQRSTFLVRLSYYCAEMGMTDGEIFSILLNADERWGKFKDRRDRVQRLTEIITKARIKYPEKSEDPTSDDSGIQIIGTFSLLQSKREIKWVIPGLLESKGSLLITGPNGVGKTQFSLNVAIALALGRSTLNFSIVEPQKMLFVSLEMGWEQLKSILASITRTLSASDLNILETQLLMLPLGEPISLNNNEKHQQAIEEAVKLHSPNGIWIDSLGSAVNGDLSNHANVQPYLDWNDRIRNRQEIFTGVIHHHRKGSKENKKPSSLDDVYGDQYITGRASSVYCLWPTKQPDVLEAIPLKLRFMEKPKSWFIKRHSDLTMTKITAKPSVLFKPPTGDGNTEDNKPTGGGLMM